jgi:anti-sigma factor RsiW
VAEHLTDDRIGDYAAGRLSDADRAATDQHVDECVECRTALGKIVGRSSTPFAGAVTRASSAFGMADTEPAVGMPKIGERLAARFTIRNHLGRGGMGHVYQATDDELGIDVALKVLRPEISADEEQVRHLRREILAGRKISHPNVCRMFDLGKADRFYFITMELIKGGTLAQRIAEGVPVATAVELLRQLLSALGVAHAEGIVHRDLKPANLMLDDAGKLKVMDFGLARDLTGEHTLKGQIGTPAYWAPEQSRGEAAGPPADIYAVGVIAYQLFTGEQAGRKRDLERVPELYRPWVQRCLQEDPDQRYADAQAALAELVAAPATERRKRASIVIGIAAIGAAAFGITIWSMKSDKSAGRAVTDRTPAGTSVPAAIDALTVTPDAALLPAPADATSNVDAGARDAGVSPSDASLRRPRDASAIGRDAAKPAPADASLLYEP